MKHTRFGRLVPATLLAAMAIGLLPSGAISADDATVDVGGMRDALRRWVETRQLISKEKGEWALGREMLSDRIDIVQNEIESYPAKIGEATESIGEADEALAELIEENETLQAASVDLQATVTRLETRAKSLIPRLPEPIRERINSLVQGIPDDPEDTKLSLSDRFLKVVGILNEVNRFNGEITVTSEFRTLPDGTTSEVTAVYVGLGQAYYVNSAGDIAGVGRPSSDGWAWTPRNDIADQVSEVIAIVRNEKAAAFVQLPLVVE